MERQASRAGVRSEVFWSQTIRATLVDIDGALWRFRREKRVDAELTAVLAQPHAKKGKTLTGRDLMPGLYSDEEHEEEWVSETMTKRAAQGAHLFFTTGATEDEDE